MNDVGVALLIAGSFAFLAIVLTTSVIGAHTTVSVPWWLGSDKKLPRSSLIVEIPILLALIGFGTWILVLFVVDPDSTPPVRFVCAVALIAMWAWLAYLGRLVARRPGAPPQ